MDGRKGDHAQLLGEELVSYLKQSNARLASKVKSYQNQCETLESKLQECERKSKDSIYSIRNFYRNPYVLWYLFIGAAMLKASYQKMYV